MKKRGFTLLCTNTLAHQRNTVVYQTKKGLQMYFLDDYEDVYAGTYAHDEAGYSDEDIDIIFDGDPSAYWNID